MKSPYESYFGKNIPRIIFLIACGIMFLGAFNYFVGNLYGASIFCVIGGILIFFTIHKQISNKTIDEKVSKTEKEYAAKYLRGRVVGKRELAPTEFSTFKGYIRDSAGVRFKVCSDKRLRTSKFYVTAISVTSKEIIISGSTFDLISEEKSDEQFVVLNKNKQFSFQTEEPEFPKGNVKCLIKPLSESDGKEISFYLPKEDYLAEQTIAKIVEMSKS